MFNFDDIARQFRSNGINPPTPLQPDERFHRFQVDEKDKKNSGWYIGFRNSTRNGTDLFVFLYGDHHDPDVTYTATSADGAKPDKQDKARIKEQIAKAQRKHAAEKKQLQDTAAEIAKRLFENASDAFGKNEYLEKKKLPELFGARISGFNLLIPMRNASGELRNVETVSAGGREKKGVYGAERSGLFHVIGTPKDVIYIAEGFSTAATVHIATNDAAVCAFNAGNLPTVATVIAQAYPNSKIVVCGDDDQFTTRPDGSLWNPGKEKAQEAANSAGGKAVFPQFQDLASKPTDWNDLYCLEGIEAVAEQIAKAEPAKAVEVYDEEYILNARYPDENEKGVRRGTLANFAELMRRHRIVIRYNVISKEEDILIPGKSFSVDNRANATIAHLVSACERVSIPSANAAAYTTVLADKNPYNPVAEWIESKPWDGETRLQDLCETIASSGNSSLRDTLIRKWLLSAIAAVYEPNGVSAHGVLVLQGAQNIGKTKWLKMLAPKELGVIADGLFLHPDDKDSVFQSLSKWIVELGELDATFRKSDIAQLKAFLTKDRDTLRRPYARKENHYARRTVFFGSVNDKDFLKDPTGNRRFWVIECQSINHEHGIDMQQLWAEVRELYLQGESWILDKEELQKLNDSNEAFTEIEPMAELIKAKLDWDAGDVRRRWIKTSELLLELGLEKPTQKDFKAACRVIRRIVGKDGERLNNGSLQFFVPVAH